MEPKIKKDQQSPEKIELVEHQDEYTDFEEITPVQIAAQIAAETPTIAAEDSEGPPAVAEEPIAVTEEEPTEVAVAEEMKAQEPASVETETVAEPATIAEETLAMAAEVAPEAQEIAITEEPVLVAAEDSMEVAETPTPEEPSFVAFIQDPYSFHSTDVSDAQNSSEPLVLDEFNESDGLNDELNDEPGDETEGATGQELLLPTPEETHAQLSSLSDAIAIEEAKSVEQYATQSAEEAVVAAERLAAEIAEDEALAQQLAQEQEQQAAQEEGMDSPDEELQAALPSQPELDESGTLDLSELQSCIEAILFMSDKPVSAQKLHELLGPDFKLNLFQEALTLLRDRYKSPSHGIELAEIAGGYQFRTKPGRAALAKKLAKVQTQKLSSGAMETLAIVSYRQPIMKEDVDKIRGVDSSYFVRGLLEKKLIRISGRSELPGRPMLYSTTQEFLELFGLKDLSSMPSLRELEQMVPASQSTNPEDEDPRVKEMRRLVGQMKADDSTNLTYNPREDEKILKEIRERVSAIPSSTPYLEELKAAELLAKQQAVMPALSDSGPAQGELPTMVPEAPSQPPVS